MAFVLALPTPEAVPVVGARELAARPVHRAAPAHRSGRRLPAFARLRAFGLAGKEELCQAAARRIVHPPIVGEDPLSEEINRRHRTPKSVQLLAGNNMRIRGRRPNEPEGSANGVAHPGGEAVGVFAERLTGYRTSKGAIQLPLGKPIDHALIADIVRWRVGNKQA